MLYILQSFWYLQIKFYEVPSQTLLQYISIYEFLIFKIFYILKFQITQRGGREGGRSIEKEHDNIGGGGEGGRRGVDSKRLVSN